MMSLTVAVQTNGLGFIVAGELCRRGWLAVVTLGNTPNTDILVSSKAGARLAHSSAADRIAASKRDASAREASGRRCYLRRG